MQLLKNYKTRRLRVISADMPLFISKVSQNGIVIYNIVPVDDLTWEFSVSSSDYLKVKALVKKAGDREKLLSSSGIGIYIEKVRKRPVLLALAILCVILSLLLPNWIFFIRVEGNKNVPTKLILEMADSAGVGFGAYRRGIRSEKVKNRLLADIEELSWIGVNTKGCVATISVQERELSQNTKQSNSVGSIVAVRDGVIADITVLRGTPQCKVGSAVNRGQVLISGYTDGGLFVRAEAASGEVFAITNRQISVISDQNMCKRQENKARRDTYWFFVGKKLIKLWKDSGISGATCVKMYETKYVTLPGGFQLPFGVLIQTDIPYSCIHEESESTAWLEDGCRDYIISQMNSGKILNSSMISKSQNGVMSAWCNYTCREMIGQFRYEEIITDYGKSN